jgi:hypothetical protein
MAKNLKRQNLMQKINKTKEADKRTISRLSLLMPGELYIRLKTASTLQKKTTAVLVIEALTEWLNIDDKEKEFYKE